MGPPLESGKMPHVRRLRRWHTATLVTVLALAAAAVAARLMAPGYVQRAINRRLSEIPGYSGHVGDIGLHLWRGAYRIDDIEIVKSNGKVPEPFFTARRIDFSVAWRDLLRGRFVSDIHVEDGRLVFLRGPTEEASQLTADHRWQDAINDIFPIDIAHLEIKGGVIRFVDTTREPHVEVAVQDIEVIATGLRNRAPDTGDGFPATVDISGRSLGNGELRLFAKLEPLAVQPHFELAVELKKVSLPALNNLLRAYAGIDASRGQLDVVGQMAMQKGHYEGYVKPFLDQVDFKNFDNDKKNIEERLWKSMAVAVLELFKNSESKRFATRVPFSGDAQGLDVKTLRTIANGLHNGFVRALSPGFEGTTHPDSAASKLPAMSPAGPMPVAEATPQF
jgi:hypothetical protein